jgi:hypothetical protein
METLDEQHKGSFGCIIGMKCGCMVVGASCFKEVDELDNNIQLV